MDAESGIGNLTVVRGALQTRADPLSLALPATRFLVGTDLVRIDAEEGLNASITEELDSSVRRRSPYALIAMAAGMVLTLLLVAFLLPVERFYKPVLRRSMPSFAEVVDSTTESRFFFGMTSSRGVFSEAGELIEEGRYADAIGLCRQELEKLPDDKAVHREWSRVWSLYFDTLLRLGRRMEVRKGCASLARIDRESDVATYYCARYWLSEIESVATRGPLDGDQTRRFISVLISQETACGFRADGMTPTAAHFGILSAELSFQRWILEGCHTDANGTSLLTRIMEIIRSLPETVDGVKLELRIWERYLGVSHPWHSWKFFERRICGEVVDRAWVVSRISELRSRLGKLGVK